MAKIYLITNDINDKVYVGKTEFSLEKRFREHCSDAFNKRCEKRPLYSAMRKYGTEHFCISLIEETDEPEEREIYWIAQYGSYVNGYNATMGGDSKKYIDYDEVVRVYGEEQNCVRVAEIMNISADSVRDILAVKGVEVASSKDVNKAAYGKTVCMMSLDGVIVRMFDSLSSASQYIAEQDVSRTNISGIREHIKGVCVGKRKTAYGYLWKFEEPTKLSDISPRDTQTSTVEKVPFSRSRVRPVQMFSLSGEYIKSFASIREAGRYIISQEITGTCVTGVANQIRSVCVKKIKTAYGYRWRFAETT